MNSNNTEWNMEIKMMIIMDKKKNLFLDINDKRNQHMRWNEHLNELKLKIENKQQQKKWTKSFNLVTINTKSNYSNGLLNRKLYTNTITVTITITHTHKHKTIMKLLA